MKFRAFLDSQIHQPDAMRHFKAHIFISGNIRGCALLIAFYVSFINGLCKLPAVGSIFKSVQSLYIGYLVESKNRNVSSLDDLPSFELPKRQFLPASNEVFDYIVIGSGPGGAVAAKKLAGRGTVLVLERGLPPRTLPENHHTFSHVLNDFHKGGQEAIFSRGIPFFTQASVVGGGAEVNSGLFHRLPLHLIDRYVSAIGISKANWINSEDAIQDLLNVSRMEVSPQNSVIARGSKSLGLDFENIQRWRTYFPDGSYSHHGMNSIIWRHLVEDSDIVMLKDTSAAKIDNSNPNFVTVHTKTSSNARTSYNGKQVVVSAGTTSTPHLLCKSRLLNWSETNFQWHQMYRATVMANESDLGRHDIDPFQSWTSDKILKFGSAVSTPGLLAFNLQRDLDEDLLRNLRSYYVSFVSTGVGGLIPKTETPWYRFSKVDRENERYAIGMLKDVLMAGGAKFTDSLNRIKFSPSTVHIFGSLPINSEIFEIGTSRLKSDNRIQVSDASLLPFGPGVNPQAIVMALANSVVCP